MIEDTQRQLREARERLQTSREALAEAASSAAEAARVEENHWLPAATATAPDAPRDRYIPDSPPEWLRPALRRLPEWSRPAMVGALIIALFTGSAMLFAALTGRMGAEEIPQALGVFFGATGAAALGGLAYTLTRARTAKLGRVGDYLTGIACMTCYLFPLAFAFRDPGQSLAESAIVSAICAVFFGVIIGHSWFGR